MAARAAAGRGAGGGGCRVGGARRFTGEGVLGGAGSGAGPDASSKLIIRVIYADEFQAPDTISPAAGMPAVPCGCVREASPVRGCVPGAGPPHSHP